MKRKRHTPEEIIKKLREAAGLIAGGKTAEEAARQIGVSVPTYHRWKERIRQTKPREEVVVCKCCRHKLWPL